MPTPAAGAAKPALTDTPPELLARIAELIPDANGLLAQTSHDMRWQLGRQQPRPPYHFHVFLDTYAAVSNASRRDLMLSALEAQAQRFRLMSIEIPDFVLDEPADRRIHPPRLASERGVVRFGVVLGGRGAALESLDLSNTHITTWREIDLALPSFWRSNSWTCPSTSSATTSRDATTRSSGWRTTWGCVSSSSSLVCCTGSSSLSRSWWCAGRSRR
jgi:hypothetical protein